MVVSPSLTTHREDVVDTLHGVAVPDPYRWLEDGESDEVRAWTETQNARTEEVLGAVPGRAALEARLRELFLVGTVSSPTVRGTRCFYLKRTGDQNQPVLHVRDRLEGEERTLVDPNAISAEGLTALDWWYPSPDGGLVAYGTSQNGDEWSTLRVVEVETGRHRPDVIQRTRYCSLAWLPDGGAFFYTRYPEPGSVPTGEEHYHSHAFFHRLGDDPASDPKVFGEGRSPQDVISLTLSNDGRWLVATAMQGWSRSEVYVRALGDGGDPGAWIPVVEGVEALFTDAHVVDDQLLLRTNLDAPNYRIVAVELGDRDAIEGGPAGWTTLVPERDDRVIEDVAVAGAGLVVHERESVVSRLRRYGLDGSVAGDLDLPGLGSVQGAEGERGNPLLAVGYTDFVTPASVFLFDLDSGARQGLAPQPPAPGFDPAQIEVRQVHYPSKDGTRIPMFLLHRRDIA
ncbi:MAG: S9 family peptidase, partial [Chloroflexota bacterium]|nr:S9 family peptidase [Chloroflexota bacterium]